MVIISEPNKRKKVAHISVQTENRAFFVKVGVPHVRRLKVRGELRESVGNLIQLCKHNRFSTERSNSTTHLKMTRSHDQTTAVCLMKTPSQ